MQIDQDRINQLSDAIEKHRHHYYNGDLKISAQEDYAPISDEEFDALCEELEALDPEAPALTAIGAEVSSEWPKVKHTIFAGSLTKVKTPQELAKWVTANFDKTNSIFWSEKMDGLTILLTYKNGELISAASRGSGTVGDELLPNVKKMRGVKTKLNEPFTGVIRGEIVMRKTAYKKHFSDYTNERNAASGISRRYDGTGSEHLDVFCYQVVSGKTFDSEVFQFQYLEQLGFQTPGHGASATEKRVEWITEVWSKYQSGKRLSLDYDIDGLVIRVNDLGSQAKLGIKHNRPVGATAFKFTSSGANSIVKDIVWQTGSSGRITPVLEIEPVKIAGAMIARVSLYNYGYIEDFKLDIGATVRIIRSGDVIPVCEAVVKTTNTVAKRPSACPACGGRVEMAGEFLMCQNASSCHAQIEGKLLGWIAKIDVKEWGDKLINRLVESKLCLTIPDLYRLTVEELSEVDRMGEKSAKKCLENLDAQLKDMTLDKFLGSLSIPLVGRTTIRLLMSAGYDTLNKIIKMTENDLAAIKGMGSEKIKALLDGLKANEKMINELIGLGVEPMAKKKDTVTKTGTSKVVGQHICITGKTSIKREALAKLIENSGGFFDKAVNAGTHYLCMVKSDSETIKAQKARAMGVAIIDETELMSLIEGA